MSWRAHPLRTVRAPDPLPLSLPAGTLTIGTRQRAVSVLVLLQSSVGWQCYYWGRWSFNQTVPKPKLGAFYGPMSANSIDWSSIR